MKRTNYSIAIVLLLVLWQCTEPYSPNLDTTYTRLAIEGYVTDLPEKQYVRLTRSADYLANEPAEPIHNAFVSVLVFEDTSLVAIDTIAYAEEAKTGVYVPRENFVGLSGYYYKLLIENVDVDEDGVTELYSAVDYMPHAIPDELMDSISLRYLSNSQFDYWQIRLWAQEPPQANWYVFHKFKNGNALSDSISLFGASSDEFYNGNYTNGAEVQNLDNHDSLEWPELNDTFMLEMWNISKEYFDHIIQTQQVISYQNPLFSGPPANVFTNVSEGAVGYFAAYSTNRETTIATYIPQEALDRREEEK